MENGIIYAIAVILGLVAGSFINALAWRLKTGESVLRGRSHCPRCRHGLAWRDLVPLLSFIALCGRCRHCKKSISWQYPAVEVIAALLAAIILWHGLASGYEIFEFCRDWFFSGILLVIFIYDLRWGIILDQVSLPSIIAALSINLLLGVSWFSLIIAAALGASFFGLQFAISRGKWIGAGDIRMGALMGAMLGWPSILVGLFLAYILGSAVAVPLLISKTKKMKSTIPLGPFLAVGTFVAMLWGQQIINWYLGL
ncbi:MAG: prepilin peptidase [Patescibacteria group bacterium]|nr:prepilin peptidase [Patescibacteria group bacterium]